jgi:hypothetical protein
MCSSGVITIGAQALASMTIVLHSSLLSHPSLLSPQLLPLPPSTANIVVNAQICSISRSINVVCCIRCIKRCIMKSDLQQKVGRKMLEERPPQKKEDGAVVGCRDG